MTSSRRRHRSVALLVLVTGLMSAPLFAAGERSPEQLLKRAQGTYDAAMRVESDRDQRLARFHQARLQLEQLVSEGNPSADLFTDIGNAALQAEELGGAILSYRRALSIDPDNDRAQQNLRHARGLLPPWVPQHTASSTLDSFFFWRGTLSRDERASYGAFAFALMVVLLAIAIRWRRSAFRNLAIVPATVWLALVISLFASPDTTDTAAVITPQGGEPALSADAPGAAPVFSNPLPAGTEVTILEKRQGWTHIVLADKSRKAWVRSGSLETIAWKPSPGNGTDWQRD